VGRAIATVPEIRVVEVDSRLYDPIIQALGVVSTSARTADAERLARFVRDDEGQSILNAFGFAPPNTRRALESQDPP
jgi:molybdate transport system substrate-binding protein